MAATRLIPLHENKGRTVSKCIKDRVEYAKNGEKTENGEYVTAYECNPEIVDQEFYSVRSEYLKDRCVPDGDIIAYQIRQSFKPGEITPDEANAIGYELAMQFTKGRHAFIVATHTDKAHIHNHIIFNFVNLTGTGKFKNFFLSSFAIQRISDRLCLEHGLSVIKPEDYRERKKHAEHPHRESYRDVIREAIDRALNRKPKDMEEFLRMLEEEEYQIKKGKIPSIRGKEQKRFIRFRSLGEGYTYKDLEEIISGKSDDFRPKRKVDLLIDIQAKLAEGKGAGYERWAKVFNVKQMAKALLLLEENGIRDLDALDRAAKEASEKYGELSAMIKKTEKRMDEIKGLKMHILNYSKTKEIYTAYRKAGYSKKFYEAHRAEITLHKAARNAFDELKLDKLPTVKMLNEEYARLIDEKREVYGEYRKAKQNMTDLAIAKYDIEHFLNMDRDAAIEAERNKKNREKSL